jgi:very-short-patch-repair endonuclease
MDEIMSTDGQRRFFQYTQPTIGWIESITSDYEYKFSTLLDRLGINYNQQEAVADKYILDFALYHKGVWLNIEIDGRNHSYGKQWKKDRFRDKYLWNNGWRVYRIQNEYLDNIDTEKIIFIKYLLIELLEILPDEVETVFSHQRLKNRLN